jgi:hypothetical protein
MILQTTPQLNHTIIGHSLINGYIQLLTKKLFIHFKWEINAASIRSPHFSWLTNPSNNGVQRRRRDRVSASNSCQTNVFYNIRNWIHVRMINNKVRNLYFIYLWLIICYKLYQEGCWQAMFTNYSVTLAKSNRPQAKTALATARVGQCPL